MLISHTLLTKQDNAILLCFAKSKAILSKEDFIKEKKKEKIMLFCYVLQSRKQY